MAYDTKSLEKLIEEGNALLAKEDLASYEAEGVQNIRDAAKQLLAGRETWQLINEGRTTVEPPKPVKAAPAKKVKADGDE